MPDDGDDERLRAPLDIERLRAQVLGPGGWRVVDVVAETGSTNADLVAAAAERDVAGEVLVAEHQHGGRGRLGRSWVAPARSGLTFSVGVRPSRPPAVLGWLPLLAGVAVVEAVSAATGVPVRLKWPNDVVVAGAGPDRKLGGLLAERVGEVVVVGIGVNVSIAAAELPVPDATSLVLVGAGEPDRTALLAAVLRRLAERLDAWDAGGSDDALRAAYLGCCATVGREVVVELPGGARVSGRAVDVDALGRLVVEGPAGRTAVAAGDVQHVR